MQDTINIDIGIRDIRQLTGFIKETHGVDYSDYALTSFKRRVEGFLTANRYNMEILLQKLESKDFLEHFMGCIAVGATEMFRDPTFWILLKNHYLADILKEQSKARIWLPLCGSGEEFYSLTILLKESGWAEHAEIFVSSMSDETLETIQRGCMDYAKLEISAKNYSRFQGTGQLTDYYTMIERDISFDTSLFVHTRFFKEGLDFEHELPLMDLILFRNQLIYFNPTLQYRMCAKLHSRLAAKGLLALGILEEMDMNICNKYMLLNREESIYQRKM